MLLTHSDTPPPARDRPIRPGWQYCLLTVMLAALLSGCSAFTDYNPTAARDLPLQLGGIQSLEEQGVRVEVAIPTDDLASMYFGVPLAENNIQPIWLRITNDSEIDYWLMPFAIDPDYYSADEAALITGEDLPQKSRPENLLLFRQKSLPFFIKARSRQEGYIYASHQRGGRFIDVRLSGHRKALRLRFSILLPTESFDYEHSELRNRYAQVDALPDVSLDQLRQQLQQLPCCTSDANGEGQGDPLNVVLIGTGENMISALTASGWNFTEAITIDSIRRMIGAAIEANAFPTAPISSLYVFGRKQDLALQRGRSTIAQRNHMRLWLAPFRCEGSPVWVGQVSRDIGVKLTTRSPSLTTHVIDPVVDEAREYLFHSLLHHDAVAQFAFVKGVGKANEDTPRFNLTDDPYITDGMRMVLWLSETPVPPHFARDLGWNESADPTREGKGENFMIPALLDP